MGQRLTQRIYECSLCNNIPQDGEHLWQMGNETWCEKCCDEQERIAKGDECHFEPTTNTSSATICKHCGREKFLHTI
jgi:hypothetical protein